MDASSVVSSLLVTQNAFSTLSMLMLTDYLFPKSAKLKDDDEFDFLIVGGGTAGCVIANRLVKANFRVLVLEAGGVVPFESFLPGTLAFVLQSRVDWNYTGISDDVYGKCHRTAEPQLPLGKVLGGSSSINFMITSRGNQRDYSRWAAAANDSSWEFKHLFPLFIRSERLLAPAIVNSPLGKYRGTGGNAGDTVDGGPGKIGIAVDNNTIVDKYLQSFKEMGNKLVRDLNGIQSTGYTRALFSIAEGVRQSTAYGYLIPAYTQDSKRRKNPKLFVSTNTLVTKIVFDKKKNAIGVMAVIKNENPIFLKAKNEVIVTAGAFKSPQLLMLSGIGPKQHLKEKGIELVSDLPVGQNLQDRPVINIVHKTIKLPPPVPADLKAFPAAVMVGFKSVDECGHYPEYGTVTYITDREDYLLGYCAKVFNFQNGICNKFYKHDKGRQICYSQVFDLYPKSRGKILLKSNNPNDAPIIQAGYFTNKEDMENIIKYIKDFIPIENTSFFKKSGGSRVDPTCHKCSKKCNDDYWRCYASCMFTSLWNYCGTCSMGAVVDSKLKVIGVKRLRVADSSVIPNLIAGGIYQPTIVVAEKASDMIKQDWKN